MIRHNPFHFFVPYFNFRNDIRKKVRLKNMTFILCRDRQAFKTHTRVHALDFQRR